MEWLELFSVSTAVRVHLSNPDETAKHEADTTRQQSTRQAHQQMRKLHKADKIAKERGLTLTLRQIR